MLKKLGKKVYLKGQASTRSLQAYTKYRSKGLPLACPCVFNNGEELEVINILSNELALLKSTRSFKITIAVWDDLTTLAPSSHF